MPNQQSKLPFSSRLKKILPSPWTFLSSLLIVFSFPPWGFSFLLPFCLIPWFISLDRTTRLKDRFREGLWLGFFMSVFGFFWIAYVLQEFAMLPFWASLMGLFLFALVNQPQFAFFALLSDQRFALPLGILGAALIYTGIDFVIPKLFQDTLGHALYSQPILRQAADLVGAWGLTFLVVYVNLALHRLWRQRRLSFHLLWALALIGACGVYGSYRRAEVQRVLHHASTRTIQAAMIQANIGDFDKVAAENGVRGAADKILNTFFDLSDAALSLNPKPDFLIWPETSYPSNFGNPYTFSEKKRDAHLRDYVYRKRTSLFFGGYDSFREKDHNALFMMSPTELPDSPELQIYRKSILLLFGESLPGSELFPALRKWFPQVGNFGRGAGPQVFEIDFLTGKKAKISPLICYEALFPWFAIQAARSGSELLLNITNDSWFGPWGEPQLHLALSTFRSIETRLPQLRSTNTGISALILPDGSIHEASRIGKAQVIPVTIPVTGAISTLLKRWGDWFGWLCVFTSMLLLPVAYWRVHKT